MELTGTWLNSFSPASVMLTKENTVKLFIPIFGDFVTRSSLFSENYPEYINPKFATEKFILEKEFQIKGLH